MKQGASFAKKQGTLLALACAAAFAVPQAAVAQVATPDFGSGKGLTLSVDFVIGVASKKATNATAANSDTDRTTEVWSSSSSVYFKGSEKLGGSIIQGWGFVITWDYDPDEYNRRGANEVGQTILGITTPAGAFFLGVNDNPYKQVGSTNVATTSTFGNGLSQSGNLGTPGFLTGTAKGSRNGSAAGGAANTTSTMSFYRLNSNSINWYSPTFAGFKIYGQYVPEDTDAPAGNRTTDQEEWSLGATWAAGPFNVGYVYERRDDYLWGSALTGNNFGAGTAAVGVGTSSKDTGQVLTAGWQIGNFKLGGYYQMMDYKQSSNAALNLDKISVDSWYVGLRWRGGPHEVGTFYFQGDDYDCSAGSSAAVAVTLKGQCESDTGVKAYGIGYRYTVSKQLRMFVSASRYDNEERAMYSGHSSSVKVGVTSSVNPAGSSYTNYSVGVAGSF